MLVADYINRLLMYVKTGATDGPFVIPKTYDWSDVVEWRLQEVYTSHPASPASPVAAYSSSKWAVDRASLLLAISDSIKSSGEACAAAAAIIGPCAVAELGACAEAGNYAAAIVVMGVFEKVAGMGGEDEVRLAAVRITTSVSYASYLLSTSKTFLTP